MVDELDGSVHTVQLTGVVPGISRLDISQGDLTPVVPVDQSLLIVDLDRPRRQQSHSVLPGDHILACPAYSQLVQGTDGGPAVSTFVVDEAGEGHVVSNFYLEAFLHGLEVRPPVVGSEENRVEIVEIVLGVHTTCRYCII